MKKIYTTFFVSLIALWIQPVMAYIDPGSGSAIMSAVIGFFVAVGIAVKTYWYKLKSFFGGKSKTAPTEENKENTNTKQDV